MTNIQEIALMMFTGGWLKCTSNTPSELQTEPDYVKDKHTYKSLIQGIYIKFIQSTFRGV